MCSVSMHPPLFCHYFAVHNNYYLLCRAVPPASPVALTAPVASAAPIAPTTPIAPAVPIAINRSSHSSCSSPHSSSPKAPAAPTVPAAPIAPAAPIVFIALTAPGRGPLHLLHLIPAEWAVAAPDEGGTARQVACYLACPRT